MLGDTVEVDYFQSDIYSLGVTMLHLCTLTLPSAIPEAYIDALRLKQAVETEASGLPFSSAFISLLRRMLEFDPAKRPNIEEVLFRMSFPLEESNEDTVTLEGSFKLKSNEQIQCRDAFKEMLRFLSCEAVKSAKIPLPFCIKHIFAKYYKDAGRNGEYKSIIEDMMLDDRHWSCDEKAEAWIYLSGAYKHEGNSTASAAALKKAMDLQSQLGSCKSHTRASLAFLLARISYI